MSSKSTTRTELPVADLTDAQIYSAGWVPEATSPLVFSIWWDLPNGATALQQLEIGAAPGSQDLQARIVYGPDR